MSIVGHCIRTVAWIILWAILFFVCIKSFGDQVAVVGVQLLVVALAVAWYVGERRDAP